MSTNNNRAAWAMAARTPGYATPRSDDLRAGTYLDDGGRGFHGPSLWGRVLGERGLAWAGLLRR